MTMVKKTLGSLKLHPQVAICAMVKTLCLVYGNPSNDRNPDSVYINPYQNAWMTIIYIGVVCCSCNPNNLTLAYMFVHVYGPHLHPPALHPFTTWGLQA